MKHFVTVIGYGSCRKSISYLLLILTCTDRFKFLLPQFVEMIWRMKCKQIVVRFAILSELQSFKLLVLISSYIRAMKPG
jgi:hypothetical protein